MGTAVIILLGLAAYEAVAFTLLWAIVPGWTGGEIHRSPRAGPRSGPLLL